MLGDASRADPRYHDASMTDDAPPFTIQRPTAPALPLVVAVPHAGQEYGERLIARARVGRDALESLEDRHADRLIAGLVADGATAIVAHAPRAAIDLNRDLGDLDPAMVDGPSPWPVAYSQRARSGLGLIPRRLACEGDLWRHRLPGAEVRALADRVHRPYHDTIAHMLRALQRDAGEAVLLDCHSMPPLPAGGAQVVIGTRHGRSCAAPLAAAAHGAAAATGLAVALNQPYAGGYTLDRHGRPDRGRHAVQVEICRSLYLHPDMRTPDPDGVARMTALLRAIGAAMIDALPGRLAEAAE